MKKNIYIQYKALSEKGWFDITAYYNQEGTYAGVVGSATAWTTAVENQLLASGITNIAPLTSPFTAGESPFLEATTGNTAYGIQYSSQMGNNGNQAETFPATVGQMAFFVVKFDAGNWLNIIITVTT